MNIGDTKLLFTFNDREDAWEDVETHVVGRDEKGYILKDLISGRTWIYNY